VLTADGKRTAAAALPVEIADAAAPPIVGYDHKVYLAGAGAVGAFDETGKPLWLKKTPGRVVGALVSTDDKLLVAAGSELATYDAAGNRSVVYSLSGASITTPPALGNDGRIYFASVDTLYCIGR
jgi:outer membrane protein assembly factor BamB